MTTGKKVAAYVLNLFLVGSGFLLVEGSKGIIKGICWFLPFLFLNIYRHEIGALWALLVLFGSFVHLYNTIKRKCNAVRIVQTNVETGSLYYGGDQILGMVTNALDFFVWLALCSFCNYFSRRRCVRSLFKVKEIIKCTYLGLLQRYYLFQSFLVYHTVITNFFAGLCVVLPAMALCWPTSKIRNIGNVCLLV